METGALLDQTAGLLGAVLDVHTNALLGANPALKLGLLDCSGQLQFCGQLLGNPSGLSTVCSTANEALLFDGDDVVTIPNNNSFINSLGQTFTIEASLRSDRRLNVSSQSQAILSNRDFSGPSIQQLLFTLYDSQYLLQLQGNNY